MRSFSNDSRLQRLAKNQPATVRPLPRIHGFAVAIDFLDGYAADARLIDRSPMLFPEKALATEGETGDRRRFSFVEFAGEGNAPRSGVARHVGDAFFADRRTADFVWQAVIEKIENDAAHIDRVESGIYRR